MIYQFVKSANFIRNAKKFAKKDQDFVLELNDTLQLLSENIFDQKLKTHKLKGDLKEYWACSINYDLRIIFKFVQAINNETGKLTETILLSNVGTHDIVY